MTYDDMYCYVCGKRGTKEELLKDRENKDSPTQKVAKEVKLDVKEEKQIQETGRKNMKKYTVVVKEKGNKEGKFQHYTTEVKDKNSALKEAREKGFIPYAALTETELGNLATRVHFTIENWTPEIKKVVTVVSKRNKDLLMYIDQKVTEVVPEGKAK